MSEVRCPFCGKTNPSNAETCQKCGSRLQPAGNSPSPFSASEGDSSDWLDNLRSDSSDSNVWSDETASPSEQEDADLPSGDVPEWLARIRQHNPENGAPEESNSPFEGNDLPDWLKDLSPAPQEDVPAESSWLSSLGNQEEPAGTEEAAEPTPFMDEPQSTAQAGGQEDWLHSLASWSPEASGGSSVEQEPSEPEIAPQGESPDDTSDWMKALSEWQGPATGESNSEPEPPSAPFAFNSEQPVEEAASPTSDEPPDWLRAFASDLPESPAGESQGLESSWLDNLGNESEETPEPAGEETPEPAPEIPNWIQAMSGSPFASEGSEEETPVQPEESAEAEPNDQPQAAPETEAPAEEYKFIYTGKEEAVPAEASEEPLQEEEEESLPDISLEEVPDWLSNIKPEDAAEIEISPDLLPAEEAGEEENTFQPVEASLDGLESESESPVGGISPEVSEEVTGEGEPLEKAQLPNWLEAMRPVEAVAPENIRPEVDQRMERSGPLAGIPGTLPSEEVAGHYHKPPVYSVKLLVTEQQRLNASLLETLVGEETTPQPIVRERRAAPQAWARFLTGLALVVVILLVWITGFHVGALPTVYPAEAVAFQNIIASLANNTQPAHVLIVVDYQTSLVGELETIAEGPVADLVSSSAQIAAISTNPSGPLLAERLLNRVTALHPDQIFDRETRFANLGYLAGGTTGLQSFAARPTMAIRSTFGDNHNAWTQPSLTGIAQLSDFDAVLVLTDSFENGRDWIEQTGAALNGKPLAFISSAQAAPLLLPYFQSGQVAGMISGLSGGVSYGFLAHNSMGVDFRYWDAYQLGIGVIVLLILIGGLFQGIGSLTRKKDDLGV